LNYETFLWLFDKLRAGEDGKNNGFGQNRGAAVIAYLSKKEIAV
jgi:hypothetical protein